MPYGLIFCAAIFLKNFIKTIAFLVHLCYNIVIRKGVKVLKSKGDNKVIDIKLFDDEKLKRNIKLSLENLMLDYEMFKDEKDKDKRQGVIEEFEDIKEEISIMIRYEIDEDSELADAVITICDKYIQMIINQFNEV